jgi:hypothetical protein
MNFAKGGRLRLLGGAVVLLTFAAGLSAGAVLFRELHDRELEAGRAAADAERRRMDCPRERTPEEVRRRQLRPYHDLGLTEQQTEDLLAVIDRNRPIIDSISRRSRAPVDSAIDRTRQEIRAILTADQAAELDRRRMERRQADSIRREEWRIRCAEQNGSPPRADGPSNGQRGR